MGMNEQTISELVAQTLGETPHSIEPMTLTHSGNTIYEVTLPSRQVIVRLRGNDEDTFAQTTHNIAALAQLGLPVPRVLAADTSKIKYPFAYVILEKIPGRDLLYELTGMTLDQITRLAEQIVGIQRIVGTLPMGTGFGWGHIGGGGGESVWFDVLSDDAVPPSSDGTILGDLRLRLHRQRVRLQPYFRRVQPLCFLEDLTTKNVILEAGEFRGIIDLDCVCFGDPVWMIGLAAGCVLNDIGTRELVYIEELCRLWELTDEQRQAVRYYSVQRALEFLEFAIANQDDELINRLVAQIEEWLSTLESSKKLNPALASDFINKMLNIDWKWDKQNWLNIKAHLFLKLANNSDEAASLVLYEYADIITVCVYYVKNSIDEIVAFVCVSEFNNEITSDRQDIIWSEYTSDFHLIVEGVKRKPDYIGDASSDKYSDAVGGYLQAYWALPRVGLGLALEDEGEYGSMMIRIKCFPNSYNPH